MLPLHSTALFVSNNQHEADLRAAETSKGEVEARSKVLGDTAQRLEGDLARLTAQVSFYTHDT